MKSVPLLDVAPLAADRVQPFAGERPYVPTGGVDDLGNLTPEPVTYASRPTRADLHVRSDDVSMARMQATRKVILLGPAHANVILSTGFAVFRPVHGRLDSRYLFHYLRTDRLQRAKDALCSGATQKAITNEKLAALEIPLPPLSEQRRIAKVLDHAEALRAKRRVALAALATLAEAILLDLVGNRASIEEVRTELLGEYLLFVTSGSRGWARYYAPTGRRFIRSLDVQMNYISNDDAVYVAPPENAEARRTEATVGDVLLTITGSRIGRVAPVPSDLEGAFVSQHVAILRVDPTRIEPTYLSFFLSLEAGGQRQIANAQYGQTKPGLNLEQIRRFQVPVPSVRLQQTFMRRISSVEKLEAAHRASLTEFHALIAAFQDRAFRGQGLRC